MNTLINFDGFQRCFICKNGKKALNIIRYSTVCFISSKERFSLKKSEIIRGIEYVFISHLKYLIAINVTQNEQSFTLGLHFDDNNRGSMDFSLITLSKRWGNKTKMQKNFFTQMFISN